MTQDDPRDALPALAGHPYLLAPTAVSGTEPADGPLTAGEVLDLGFGAADGLVELHARGLAHGRITPSSLVSVPSGGLCLVLPATAVESGDPAPDVAGLRAALAWLLPVEPDPLTDAARSVLTDPTITTAAGLRDALAAVRLGQVPPRSSMPVDPSSPTAVAAGSGVPAGPAGDRTPLQARDSRPEPEPAGSPPSQERARSAAMIALAVMSALIVVAVVVFLMLR